MRSRVGYVLGAIALLAGIAMAIWVVLTGIASVQDALVRVVVPGSIELTLDRAGTYTIFHEADSVVDGKLYAAHNIAGLSVTVTGDNGQQIAVTVPNMSSKYSVGGHSGKSVLAFDVPKPGRYVLSAQYANGRSEPQTVLAVSRGFLGRLLGTIFGAIGSVALGFLVALVLILTTYFRRRRMLAVGTPPG